MPTMHDVRLEDGMLTMLKGEPGTRKSTQALSYPTPQYWVNSDQKMESLILPMKRWGISPNLIEYDNYADWDAPKKKLNALQVNCKYKTIIVDSMTTLGDGMNRQTINQKVKDGTGGKKIGSIYVPGMEEYNAEASAFSELVAILKDISKHHKINVIIIAHVVGQRKQDDGNKLTHHSRVILTGGDKISGKISANMTEVYHFNVEAGFDVDADSDKYALFTKHTGNDYARTSLPLPKKIIFNDKPLYDTFILPAINSLNAEQPIERIKTTTTPSTIPTKNNNDFAAN